MRILFLAPSSNYHTKKWCGYFVKAGYDVHVVSLTDGEIEGVTVHTLSVKDRANDTDMKKLLYLFSIRKIYQIVKIFKPDYISVHYATSYGLLAALSRIGNYTLSVWGTDIFAFPQKSVLHKIVLQISLKQAKQLMSTSIAMASEAAKYTSKKFEITPFGVDMDLFTPQKRSRNDAIFRVGNIKSISEEYGIDYLIKAIYIVSCRRPDIQIELRLAGKGPKEVEYKLLAEELGIASIITWLGFISQEDAAFEWANFDLGVIPSVRESFGVSAVEAQASGIPVIITDVDGLKEATNPGKTSYVVPVQNEVAIAEAIIYLYDHRDERLSMGNNGRNFVLENFEYTNCFERIEKIIRTVERG